MSASWPANLVRDSRLFVLERLALLLLQQDLDARDDLFDVDRLGEVVLDAQLEPADLVLDVGLRRQEDERDRRPVGVLLEPLDELEAVHLRHLGVGDDEVGRRGLDLAERVEPVDRGRDVEAGLLQADFENAKALGVTVDEKEALLGHLLLPEVEI